MTRTQLIKFRRRDNRRKWARRLFLPISLIGPLLVVGILTALDPHTSLAQDFQWMKAEAICREYGAQLHHLSPDNRFMTIAIPDDLTNDTDTGCYQASQLFHKLCTLGGPRMELQVWRINPVYVFTGGPADTKDAGELWEERHSGIPSAVNPMTLQWTTRLIQGDPYE